MTISELPPTRTRTQGRQRYFRTISGNPEWVAGQVALEKAHGRFVTMGEPVLVRENVVAVKVELNAPSTLRRPNPFEAPASSSTELAVRQQAAPATTLQHPAAKPGWSTGRKLAVFCAVALPTSALLGWLVSQLIELNLKAMATTVLGFAALFALIFAVLGSGGGCGGLHCGGCSSH